MSRDPPRCSRSRLCAVVFAGAAGSSLTTGCGAPAPQGEETDAAAMPSPVAAEAGPKPPRGASHGGADGASATDGTRDETDAASREASTSPSPPRGPEAAADAGARAEGGALGCGAPTSGGGPMTTTMMHLDVGVHDPAMVWDGTHYVLFATGGALAMRSSADILTWNAAGAVFSAIPAWVTTALGSTPPALWAPDISYFNGSFHAYYAGSTFGSNRSVIGLATSTALSPAASWLDNGLVVQSRTTDDFNAIDPNVSFDENCRPWLAFGSFWSGIKLLKLDAATGLPATDDTTVYAIASRGGGAIEAPSIISHGGYYYLFVSFDRCCQGANSTYRTMVGRATAITGPYTDKSGTPMMQGAAEQLLATSGRYIGPGGGTAWKNGNAYLYVYHYYDGQANGASKLAVRPIAFDASAWVTLGDPLFP